MRNYSLLLNVHSLHIYSHDTHGSPFSLSFQFQIHPPPQSCISLDQSAPGHSRAIGISKTFLAWIRCCLAAPLPFNCLLDVSFVFLDRTMLENSNPQVYHKKGAREFTLQEMDDQVIDLEPMDAREVFDLIRDIRDPEHPLTLEELNVVNEEDIDVDNEKATVLVKFTPTINHCSLATLIGLAIQVKLLRCLPSRFKIDVRIAEGTHATEDAVNKQLGDKERVAAALENPNLLEAVNQCIAES